MFDSLNDPNMAKKFLALVATFFIHTGLLWVAFWYAGEVWPDSSGGLDVNYFELTGLTAVLYALRFVFRNEFHLMVKDDKVDLMLHHDLNHHAK